MIQQNHPRTQEPPMHAHITQARTHHAPTPTQTTTPPTRHTHTHTKMTQIHANCLNFVRISYEIHTKFVTTTFTVRIEGRNSYEIRTNFVRISCELRTNLAPFLQDTGRRATPTPPMHVPESPHPHTFPYTCPPGTHTYIKCSNVHTHTHTAQTHTHTHTQEEGATPSFMYRNIQRSSRGGWRPPWSITGGPPLISCTTVPEEHTHTHTHTHTNTHTHTHTHGMWQHETTTRNIPQSGCTQSHGAMNTDAATPWRVNTCHDPCWWVNNPTLLPSCR